MAVATTGFFDGVHTGHRQVIGKLVSTARERGDESLVLTFWPHQRTVFQRDARDLRLLNSLDEKKALLASLGVDRTEVLPFTKSFAALTAQEYIRDILVARFGVTAMVVGYDNTLGSDVKGYDDIVSIAKAFDVEVVPAGIGYSEPVDTHGHKDIISHGIKVSSPKIRKALEAGEIETAEQMLGYRYGLRGVVVAGNRMGRTIGFPTANMQLYEPLKLVPCGGVYAVDVEVMGRQFQGMCNIGVRPTVGGTFRTIETNIFDFDEDLYGLDLTIRFRRFLRPEQKFPSLEALRDQLTLDRIACKA